MKRTATLLAALVVSFAATAATVRTATETFVTNKIAEAVAALPAPDFSTNNAALVETIAPLLTRAEAEEGFTEWEFSESGNYRISEWHTFDTDTGTYKWATALYEGSRLISIRYRNERQTIIDWSPYVSGLITSRTRLRPTPEMEAAWDAKAPASHTHAANEVEHLAEFIAAVSPVPDLSGYATTDDLATVEASAITGATNSIHAARVPLSDADAARGVTFTDNTAGVSTEQNAAVQIGLGAQAGLADSVPADAPDNAVLRSTAVAIGANARATGTNSSGTYSQGVAVGWNATAAGMNGIAIGGGAKKGLETDMTGDSTYAAQEAGIAIGYSAKNTGPWATAIGPRARASGEYALSLGSGNMQNNNSNPTASGDKAIAAGYATSASGGSAVAIGSQAKATADRAVQIGAGTNGESETLKFRDTTVVKNGRIVADATINANSQNPVQNKAVAAALASCATAESITNTVRALSLGGIWDEDLQIWWTPHMADGSLTYMATTNVNLNAGN